MMIKRKGNNNNNGGQVVGGVLKNGKRNRVMQSDD